MPYHSTSHIAQSVGSTIRAISSRCVILAETRMRRERRFRTTWKILYDGKYRSVQTDRAELAHIIIHGSSSQNRAERVPREAYLVIRAGLARHASKAGLVGSFIFVSRACRVRLACLAHNSRTTSDDEHCSSGTAIAPAMLMNIVG